jgi:hypothetical protein
VVESRFGFHVIVGTEILTSTEREGLRDDPAVIERVRTARARASLDALLRKQREALSVRVEGTAVRATEQLLRPAPPSL